MSTLEPVQVSVQESVQQSQQPQQPEQSVQEPGKESAPKTEQELAWERIHNHFDESVEGHFQECDEDEGSMNWNTTSDTEASRFSWVDPYVDCDETVVVDDDEYDSGDEHYWPSIPNYGRETRENWLGPVGDEDDDDYDDFEAYMAANAERDEREYWLDMIREVRMPSP